MEKAYTIIFLDIDGVVATHKSYMEYPDRDDLLDRKCIQCLNYLVKKVNGKIVISSSWRWEKNIVDKLKNAGLVGKVIGITDTRRDINDGGRGQEIFDWLYSNKHIGDYIIVDDELFDIIELHPPDKLLYTGWGTFMRGGLSIKAINGFLEERGTRKIINDMSIEASRKRCETCEYKYKHKGCMPWRICYYIRKTREKESK